MLNRRVFLRTGSSNLFVIQPAMYLFAQKTTGSGRIQRLDTPYGGLILTDLSLTLHDQTIHGAVTNDTDRAWRWVSLLLRMHDASGRLIPHDDGFDGHFYVKDIGRGESKQITDRKGKPARLLLRPSGHPVTFEAEFVADRSYFDSRYVFSLVSPRHSKELAYQDEWLDVRFNPTKDRLFFKLSNRSLRTVQIDWEKVIYVDLSGKKHRVIHQGVPLADKDNQQMPKALEAGASLESSLYPADMVAGSRLFNDWRLNPILPQSQHASHYKWRTFAVLLPLEFGPQTRPYQFTVRIEDVVV